MTNPVQNNSLFATRRFWNEVVSISLRGWNTSFAQRTVNVLIYLFNQRCQLGLYLRSLDTSVHDLVALVVLQL